MNGRPVLLAAYLGLGILACHGSSGSPDAGSFKDAEGPGAGQDGVAGQAGASGRSAPSTAGDGGSTSLDPTDPTEVCRAAIRVQAERAATCLGQDMLDYYLSTANACPDFLFNPDSNRKVEEVAACLPALRARTCTDIAAVVMPTCYANGKRAGKASCAFSSQCKNGACSTDGRQCGTCVEDASGASPCRSWGACAFGSHCTSGGECALNGTPTYAAEGEACDLNATPLQGCVGDLYCRLTGDGRQGICTASPGAGKPCGNNGMSFGVLSTTICAPGTTCVYGTCQLPGGCGTNQTCDSGEVCTATETGSLQCSPKAKLGQACTDLGSANPCLAPTTCLNSKCVVPRKDGETCDADSPCDRYLLCVGGKCQKMNVATCPA
jgi:hypothetical protein